MSKLAVLPEFASGHVDWSCFARVLSMLGSRGESLLKNVPQVCVPDKATTSVTSKFLAVKTPVVLKGLGRSRVPHVLKLRPSRLPSSTA
ncbi:hypothetical protein GYH30_003359 [Glycine max]|nr:hypothetical protein GYH30_003359 [Glycine max]